MCYCVCMVNSNRETSPKPANPVDLKDLRPIIVLPCISIIAERDLCEQLISYLEDNNILPVYKLGFQTHHSTSALFDVTDNIISAQDKGLCTLLVLLDFTRAFECINLDLLLSKLSYYGFDIRPCHWSHSYTTISWGTPEW